jgi:hypothetical protein
MRKAKNHHLYVPSSQKYHCTVAEMSVSRSLKIVKYQNFAGKKSICMAALINKKELKKTINKPVLVQT